MATLNIKNLPDKLYKKLQARAKSQHRSVTQEVTHILTEVLERPPTHSILELRGLGLIEPTAIPDPTETPEWADSRNVSSRGPRDRQSRGRGAPSGTEHR